MPLRFALEAALREHVRLPDARIAVNRMHDEDVAVLLDPRDAVDAAFWE